MVFSCDIKILPYFPEAVPRGFLSTKITESPRRNIFVMNLSLFTGFAWNKHNSIIQPFKWIINTSTTKIIAQIIKRRYLYTTKFHQLITAAYCIKQSLLKKVCFENKIVWLNNFLFLPKTGHRLRLANDGISCQAYIFSAINQVYWKPLRMALLTFFFPLPVLGNSVHISLTFSRTILQCLSKAFTLPSNFLLFLQLISTWVLFLTDCVRTDNGPVLNSSSSLLASSSGVISDFGLASEDLHYCSKE